MARFYNPPESRLLISKWDPSIPQAMPMLTFLEERSWDRRASFVLGGPASFGGTVAAADPEINILHDDNFATASAFWDVGYESDYPFLAEGVRLLHWLRKEAPGEWKCRFSGPILGTEDAGDPDYGETRFTAYDPWAYLFKRPCLRCVLDETDPSTCELDGDGLAVVHPEPSGIVVFPAGTELQFIAGELLRRTLSANGPCMIDAGDGSSGSGDGNDYGGTADWTGTIETCGVLTQNWVIQDGASVGEVWAQLHETGLMKIILTPIYDPDRPGICADLNIFRTDDGYDGLVERQTAIDPITAFPLFSWDRSGHDMIEVLRTIDGTERVTQLVFLGPQGYRAGLWGNTQAISRFGEWWAQEAYQRLTRNNQIDVQAEQELYRRMKGRAAWQIAPTPEFTYRPFQDYDIGWYCGLYHSARLRQQANPYGYFLRFDLALSDLGVENVTGAVLSVEDTFLPEVPS